MATHAGKPAVKLHRHSSTLTGTDSTTKPAAYIEDITGEGKDAFEGLRKLNDNLVFVSPSWLHKFLGGENQGVTVIYNLIQANNNKKSGHSISIVNECLVTVEFLLETEEGCNIITNHSQLIKEVIGCLELLDWPIFSSVFRIIGYLVLVVGQRGHGAVVDGINAFNAALASGTVQNIKAKNFVEFTMKRLTDPSVPNLETYLAGLTLINGLISVPEDLEDRLKIRLQWVRAGLTDILNIWKETFASDSEELNGQIEIFEQEAKEDEKQKQQWAGSRIGGVRKDEPTAMFHYLVTQAQGESREAYAQLLHVLQDLAMIETQSTIPRAELYGHLDTLLKKHEEKPSD